MIITEMALKQAAQLIAAAEREFDALLCISGFFLSTTGQQELICENTDWHPDDAAAVVKMLNRGWGPGAYHLATQRMGDAR